MINGIINTQNNENNSRIWQKLQTKDYSDVNSLMEWIDLARDAISKNEQKLTELENQKQINSIQISQWHEQLTHAQKQTTPDIEKIQSLEAQIFQLTQNIDQATLLLNSQNKFLLTSLTELIQEDFWQERKEQALNNSDESAQKTIADLESIILVQKDIILQTITRTAALSGSLTLSRRDSLISALHSRENSVSVPLPIITESIEEESMAIDYQIDLKNHLQRVSQVWTDHLNGIAITSAYQGQEKIMKSLVPLLEQCLTSFDNPEQLTDSVNELLANWNTYHQWQDGLSADKFWLKYFLKTSQEETETTVLQIQDLQSTIKRLEITLQQRKEQHQADLGKIAGITHTYIEQLAEAKLRKDEQYKNHLNPKNKQKIMAVAEKDYKMVKEEKYNRKKLELKKVEKAKDLLSQNLANERTKNQSLLEELTNLKAERESLLTQQQEFLNDNKGLTQKLASEKKQRLALEINNIQARNDVIQLQEQVEMMKISSDNFTSLYDKQVNDASHWEDENSFLRRENEELKQINEDLQNDKPKESEDNLTDSDLASDFDYNNFEISDSEETESINPSDLNSPIEEEEKTAEAESQNLLVKQIEIPPRN